MQSNSRNLRFQFTPKAIHLSYHLRIAAKISELLAGGFQLTDEGDKREYSVGKETFESIYEGQASTLVIVDGQFFAFEDGEEIMDE